MPEYIGYSELNPKQKKKKSVLASVDNGYFG